MHQIAQKVVLHMKHCVLSLLPQHSLRYTAVALYWIAYSHGKNLQVYGFVFLLSNQGLNINGAVHKKNNNLMWQQYKKDTQQISICMKNKLNIINISCSLYKQYVSTPLFVLQNYIWINHISSGIISFGPRWKSLVIICSVKFGKTKHCVSP